MDGCILPGYTLSEDAKHILRGLLSKQDVDDKDREAIFFSSIESACQLYLATKGDDTREKDIPVQLFKVRSLVSELIGILGDEEIKWEAENILMRQCRSLRIDTLMFGLENLQDGLGALDLQKDKKKGSNTDVAGHTLCEMLLNACVRAGFRDPYTYTNPNYYNSTENDKGSHTILEALRVDGVIGEGYGNGIMKTLLDSRRM